MNKPSIIFVICIIMHNVSADVPVNDIAMHNRSIVDMAMLENNELNNISVDYDAENDYPFPTYIKDIYQHDITVNIQNDQGTTLLMLLADKSSHKNLMKFVLYHLYASTNIQDNKGRTALHFAASSGYLPLISLLLDSGANINIQDYEGKTPLYYAVEKNNVQVVELLLKKGADKYIGLFENGILPEEICKSQAMKNLFKIIKT